MVLPGRGRQEAGRFAGKPAGQVGALVEKDPDNLCRMHKSVRMTPAMAASLTLRPWSIGDLLVAARRDRFRAG